MAGGTGAGTAAPKRVLMLTSTTTYYTPTPLGFNANENAPAPIGSGYIADIALFNQRSQFGKPSGARIGSAELQCAVASRLRDLCTGVAHLPNGFSTFSNAPRHNANPVTWYAVTGGVAGYATARGQIKVTSVADSSNSKSYVVVTSTDRATGQDTQQREGPPRWALPTSHT
ncbi:MAG: hypothetical protein ABI783_06155 [Actinomycetota bacterium]